MWHLHWASGHVRVAACSSLSPTFSDRNMHPHTSTPGLHWSLNTKRYRTLPENRKQSPFHSAATFPQARGPESPLTYATGEPGQPARLRGGGGCGSEPEPGSPRPFTSWAPKTQLLTCFPRPHSPVRADRNPRLTHLQPLIQSLSFLPKVLAASLGGSGVCRRSRRQGHPSGKQGRSRPGYPHAALAAQDVTSE